MYIFFQANCFGIVSRNIPPPPLFFGNATQSSYFETLLIVKFRNYQYSNYFCVAIFSTGIRKEKLISVIRNGIQISVIPKGIRISAIPKGIQFPVVRKDIRVSDIRKGIQVPFVRRDIRIFVIRKGIQIPVVRNTRTNFRQSERQSKSHLSEIRLPSYSYKNQKNNVKEHF